MTGMAWGAVIVAGVVSLAAPFGLRPLLHRLGVFDVPNHRSSHSRITLRGGGVAPLLGILVGGIWAGATLDGEARLLVGVVIAAAVIMSLVGLAEDIRGLRVVVRAGLQLLIGAAIAVTLGAASGIHWLWIPVAALFFAANVNFTNFMDGVNGISGIHGLVVGLIYAALGALSDLPGLVAVGLIIAASFVAFVPWNFAPPGMFLGDVGSYLLGGVVGATAIAALTAGLDPVAALAPLAIYWADAVSTLFRRAAQGEPVFEAHRSHAYQRLTNTGFSHIVVAVIVGVFTAAVGGIGLLVGASLLNSWLAAVLILVGAVGFLTLPRLRGDVLPPRTQYSLAPAPRLHQVPAREGWAPTEWAVVGASGFIGQAVVKYLAQQGIQARELAAPRLELDPTIRDGGVVADLAREHASVAEWATALVGADIVVNAAGMASPDSIASSKLYGANALLPAFLAAAAVKAGVGRVVHLSSAAVQGDRAVLDASPDVSPFSPYSHSKALGERALLAAKGQLDGPTDIIIVRATSVQGPGRPTTEALRRIAHSPLASVAAPGDHPSVVSSVGGLVRCVREVAVATSELAPIILQPWEGLNVAQVLELAGGRRPTVLPRGLCRPVIAAGKLVGRAVPRVAGLVRRVEVMWFGQAQEAGYPAVGSAHIAEILAGENQRNA